MSREFMDGSSDRREISVILSVRRLTSSSIDIATSFCLWSLCGWNKAGLNYLIISELSEAEMEKLEDPLREHRRVVGPAKDVRLYGIKEYRSCVLLICRRAYKSESELFDLIVSPQRNPGAEATRHQPDTKKVNP
jgi:hypothetical protein